MDRSGIGRVRQQATRAALPVVTRQAHATAALAGPAQSSRSGQATRGTPTRRDDTDTDDDTAVSGREDDDTDDDEPEPVAP